MMQNYDKNNASLEEANTKIILLALEIDAVTEKLTIKEKLLLASNKEREELNQQLVNMFRELEQANVKLKEMDKRKSDFVANVSHEFKNPLIVIRFSLELILEELEGKINADQKETLTGAHKSAERLTRLVTDMLDLSKIESGKMELKIENFDIGLLVNEILSTYEREFSKNKISFSKNIPSDIGMIRADRDKLSEVIINLLTNAIKYTPDGGAVGIKLVNKENELYFEISDSGPGPGIPEEYKDKIFDKFERITAESIEGTGLGLPIAKDIVNLHKGRIWVESPAWPNLPAGQQGSKFIFTLPREGSV